MAEDEIILLKEAEKFERAVSPHAYRQDRRRRGIRSFRHPKGGREQYIRVSDLTPAAQQIRLEGQARAAFDKLINPKTSDVESLALQPSFFGPISVAESRLRDAAPVGIPKSLKPYIEKWSAILGQVVNGTYRKRHRRKGEKIRELAHEYGTSENTIRAKLTLWNKVEHDPEIPHKEKGVTFWKESLPKNRPGMSRHSYWHVGDGPKLAEAFKGFYCNQAKYSIKEARRFLVLALQENQKAWGLKHA
jgi:hypothetical protein